MIIGIIGVAAIVAGLFMAMVETVLGSNPAWVGVAFIGVVIGIGLVATAISNWWRSTHPHTTEQKN